MNLKPGIARQLDYDLDPVATTDEATAPRDMAEFLDRQAARKEKLDAILAQASASLDRQEPLPSVGDLKIKRLQLRRAKIRKALFEIVCNVAIGIFLVYCTTSFIVGFATTFRWIFSR